MSSLPISFGDFIENPLRQAEQASRGIPSTLGQYLIGRGQQAFETGVGKLGFNYASEQATHNNWWRDFWTWGYDPVSIKLSKEKANELYGIPGKLVFDQDIREEAAIMRYNLKQGEIDRLEKIQNFSETGITSEVLGLGADIVGSLLDPVQLGSMFIPVVGEARAASWTAKLGKVGGRAAVGIVEGAVGAALTEGPRQALLAASPYEQPENRFTEALGNIALGGVMGGGLHAGTGLIGDLITSRRISPKTHVTALQTGIGQLLSGEEVNVRPVIEAAERFDNQMDPNIVRDARAVRAEGNKVSTQAELFFEKLRSQEVEALYDETGKLNMKLDRKLVYAKDYFEELHGAMSVSEFDALISRKLKTNLNLSEFALDGTVNIKVEPQTIEGNLLLKEGEHPTLEAKTMEMNLQGKEVPSNLLDQVTEISFNPELALKEAGTDAQKLVSKFDKWAEKNGFVKVTDGGQLKYVLKEDAPAEVLGLKSSKTDEEFIEETTKQAALQDKKSTLISEQDRESLKEMKQKENFTKPPKDQLDDLAADTAEIAEIEAQVQMLINAKPELFNEAELKQKMTELNDSIAEAKNFSNAIKQAATCVVLEGL